MHTPDARIVRLAADRAASVGFRTAITILSLVTPATGVAHAQESLPIRKQAQAVRVANGSVRLDGRLDEEVWTQPIPIVDFTQKRTG